MLVYIFKGSNSTIFFYFIFFFLLLSQWGSTLKGKNLLPKEQILSVKSRSHCGRVAFFREQTKRKLSPLIKLAEKHKGYTLTDTAP